MSALSDFAENKLVDHLFRAQAWSLPASVYIALFTAAPSDAGGGTEVSGGGYARVAVSRSTSAFSGTQSAGSTTASSGTGGVSSNNSAITFPTPSGNWGTITHVGIFDASSGGNLIAHGALSASKVVNTGDAPPVFPAGSLSLTLA